LLYKNKIIGLWNGPLEWGPRALGNRSIILNTFDKTVNDTLNKRLNRTEFMPFAPVVLDKCAKKYFPKYEFKVPAADYMTITYDTDPKYHDLLQATVHIDGTARPQVVNKHISPLYYSILNEFHNISGCGAMVNTSFNAHEEPILSNPTTAINSLLTERVDYLVMENYLFYLKQKK
ncbi:MAG: carbamoyltransferase, partial [Crocinitomicaceae bacterium]|nr:carbamoyltransferase [Crocinitomicaceae bacterium]